MAKKGTATAALAIALGACMTGPASSKCTVTGAEYLASGETADEICAMFADRLAQSDVSARVESPSSVAIALTKMGSAQAIVVSKQAGQQVKHPVVAVDVTDRPLRASDIMTLADAVADMLQSTAKDG